MKDILPRILRVFSICATMLCGAHVTRAQDPVKVDPDHYKVLQETATVRILEYRDTPGHQVPKHSHPNYFVYVFSNAKRLFTTNCSGPGNTVMLTAGESLNKPAITHCEKNTGKTDTHLLVVEYKSTPKKPKPLKSQERH